MRKRKEVMKESRVPLFSFSVPKRLRFVILKEQSGKSTKHDKTSVTGFKKHVSLLFYKGTQRRNSDLTVTGKRHVPNFQNFLNVFEVCSSLKQDSNDARKMFRYKRCLFFFCITSYSLTTLFKSKVFPCSFF